MIIWIRLGFRSIEIDDLEQRQRRGLKIDRRGLGFDGCCGWGGGWGDEEGKRAREKRVGGERMRGWGLRVGDWRWVCW